MNPKYEIPDNVMLHTRASHVSSTNCALVCMYMHVSSDRLCGLVVSVEDYKHRGPGFDSRALLSIFLRELGLERGPLSLVIG
jgi:hypothetical protein